MNNAVYLGSERVGFRCWTCGGVFQSMWGTTCNGCRERQKQHDEMVQKIVELTKAIQNQK